MEIHTTPQVQKTQFGLKHFSSTPPKWVVPTLSIIVFMIGIASFMISGDTAIPDELKHRIIHYLTGATMFFSGLAPFFGGKIKK